MRVVGFMALGMLLISWSCQSTRLPPLARPSGGGWRSVKFVDLSAFKNPAYSSFVVGATLVMFGLYTPFTYSEPNFPSRPVTRRTLTDKPARYVPFAILFLLPSGRIHILLQHPRKRLLPLHPQRRLDLRPSPTRPRRRQAGANQHGLPTPNGQRHLDFHFPALHFARWIVALQHPVWIHERMLCQPYPCLCRATRSDVQYWHEVGHDVWRDEHWVRCFPYLLYQSAMKK